MRIVRAGAISLICSRVMMAHGGEAIALHDLWSRWRFDPGITIPLIAAAVLYARGARTSRGVSKKQTAYFWSGWLVLVLSLCSPLHPLGEVLFSVHMTQHELLMLAAAPLLVLSRPLAALLWGLPLEWRRAAGRVSKTRAVHRARILLTGPFTAWALHAIILWTWHAPVLFQATLENDAVHSAQHICFLGSALLFWWSLFHGCARGEFGWGVLYIFTTAIHTSILGALLTFSPTVWYPAYKSTASWGLTPIEDQQIGGLIMWVPAGLVYLAAGLALFAAWLCESDRRTKATAMASLLGVLLLGGCGNDTARAAAEVTGGDPSRGPAAIFHYGCGSCHTIKGISNARGLVGPPLTGLRNRTFVAGMLINTPENLTHWIREPKSVNPQTAMPQLGVNSRDATDIAAYLYSIK